MGHVRSKALVLKDGTIVYHRKLYSNPNGTTYLVLPIDYVRDVGLNSGDEVVLVRKNEKLMILPAKFDHFPSELEIIDNK